MDQVSPQEKFKQLIKLLKMPVAIVPASTLERAVMGYRNRDEFLDDHAPTAIKIMESGIFYEGGLRSSLEVSVVSGKACYDSYSIRNLEEFVYALAMFFDVIEKQLSLSQQQSIIDGEFQKADRSIERLIPIVSQLRGKRNSNRLKRVQEELADIRDRILNERDTTPRHPNSNVKQAVAELFARHINAPDKIIADRVSELLTSFEIKTGSESIRKKLHKRRVRQAVLR